MDFEYREHFLKGAELLVIRIARRGDLTVE